MPSPELLPPTWDVPQRFRDRLGSKVGRQRAMVHDDHLLLVLHAPPEADQDERQGRFFWRKPDCTWVSDQLGEGLGAVTKHLDEYDKRIDVLDKKEEQAKSSEDYFAVLESLTPLHRAARNLLAVLQDARKRCPEARETIDFRDRAYELERTAELLFTGTKNALDFQMAQRAEEQSRASERMAVASHRLNVLAAFFFPLATLSAIFGMDIPSGLVGVPKLYLFVGVIMIGLVLGAILTLFMRVPKNERG